VSLLAAPVPPAATLAVANQKFDAESPTQCSQVRNLKLIGDSHGLLELKSSETSTAAAWSQSEWQYCVRIQVHYPRHAWDLSVYFLAAPFDRAMEEIGTGASTFYNATRKKTLVLGCRRAEDLGFSAEFLKEAGLTLDRRQEFPAQKRPTCP